MRRTGSQQRVIVKHISDQDVEHHIKVLGAKPRRRTQRLNNNLASVLLHDTTPVGKKKRTIQQNNADDFNGDIDEDVLASLDKILPRKKPNKVASTDDKIVSVSVTDIYNFKTPKKANQMTKFALESAKKSRLSEKENKNPKKTANFEAEAPKKAANTVEVETPIKMREVDATTPLKKSKRMQSETPSRKPTVDTETSVRKSKRIQVSQKFRVQEILARVQEDDDSDESDESANDDEEDEDQDQLESKPSTNKGLEMPTASELYFEAHKTNGKLTATTSNRTMSRLKTSQISFNEMQTILDTIEKEKFDTAKKVKGHKSISDDIKVEISRLKMISSYRTYFSKWMFHMSHNFNIILFGLGSKRKLLHNFCQEMLEDFDKVIINGFFPSLLIKSVLNSICDVIDDVTISSNSQQSQVEAICDAYSSNQGRHLFLIVHNIDGVNLRNRKAQEMFCRFSQCPRIHIIATIDHINASIMWDQSTIIKFNWLWYDVTTFEWYKDETSYENSLSLLTSGGGVGGSLALSGLLHVIRSLTPNARGIFKLIIENQIDETKSDTTNCGMSFTDLYQTCREKFLVNSELTLRSQLTEFLDHKLIQIKKGLDGVENLSIPLDKVTLKEYLEQAE